MMTNRRMTQLDVIKHCPKCLMETKVEDVMSEFIAAIVIRLSKQGEGFNHGAKINTNIHTVRAHTRVLIQYHVPSKQHSPKRMSSTTKYVI